MIEIPPEGDNETTSDAKSEGDKTQTKPSDEDETEVGASYDKKTGMVTKHLTALESSKVRSIWGGRITKNSKLKHLSIDFNGTGHVKVTSRGTGAGGRVKDGPLSFGGFSKRHMGTIIKATKEKKGLLRSLSFNAGIDDIVAFGLSYGKGDTRNKTTKTYWLVTDKGIKKISLQEVGLVSDTKEGVTRVEKLNEVRDKQSRGKEELINELENIEGAGKENQDFIIKIKRGEVEEEEIVQTLKIQKEIAEQEKEKIEKKKNDPTYVEPAPAKPPENPFADLGDDFLEELENEITETLMELDKELNPKTKYQKPRTNEEV